MAQLHLAVLFCIYGVSAAHRATARVSVGEAAAVSEGLTVSSLALQRSLLQRARLQVGSGSSLASTMRSMTLPRAMEIVGRKDKLPQSLRSFLQTLHERQRVVSVGRHNSLRRYDSQGAAASLNVLAVQARRKLDLEEVQCSEYELRQVGLMEEARREQDEFAAQSAAARARILGAQATIGRAKKSESSLIDSMDRHARKCDFDAQVVRRQLNDAEEDIVTMRKVSNSANCSELQALVQCNRRAPSLAAGQRTLRLALRRARPPHRHHLRLNLLQTLASGSGSGSTPPLDEFTPGGDTPPVARCVSREVPTCGVLQDRLLMIQTGMLDKVDDIRAQLAATQRDCVAARNTFSEELESVEFRVREAQTALAESISVETQTEEQSRMKRQQVSDLEGDHLRTMRQCRANMDTFEHEICGIKRIRSELYAASGNTHGFVQDCEVSGWTPDECSQSCGGGSQTLRRTVVSVPTEGGTPCPPLEMVRRCSDRSCPVDCEVGEWSRWSSCTAACGGGVRQRARSVVRPSNHGGRGCGETSEVEACNLHSCTRDCELADWSEWSPCSRMCGGGLRQRIKSRTITESGDGQCPSTRSEQRLTFEACNAEKCEIPPGRLTLLCNTSLDILLLLQGSSSLQESGWEAMKSAAGQLVSAFNASSSRVGALLYSGPRSMTTFMRCSRGVQPGEQVPDMAADCSIRWVSHLTQDVDSVAEMIAGLSFPRGTTLTSAALTTILPELRGGRLDARSVVIVLTDGRPMSPRLTQEAAKLVRQRARLLWVPISLSAPLEDIKRWASTPVHENVISVKSFDQLVRPATINAIVSSVCPQVK